MVIHLFPRQMGIDQFKQRPYAITDKDFHEAVMMNNIHATHECDKWSKFGISPGLSQ